MNRGRSAFCRSRFIGEEAASSRGLFFDQLRLPKDPVANTKVALAWQVTLGVLH